jgi:hypothetical protein
MPSISSSASRRQTTAEFGKALCGDRIHEPQGEETTMKCFTRDLYRRCHFTDETILNAACEEWEQANEAYEQHLAAIEPEFPPHLREFAGLLLHDTKVQSIARQGNQLILILHKDSPPRDLVILNYELEGEPVMEPFAVASPSARRHCLH